MYTTTATNAVEILTSEGHDRDDVIALLDQLHDVSEIAYDGDEALYTDEDLDTVRDQLATSTESLVIYAEPTATVAGNAGDHDTANDTEFCRRNDALITAKAEADGYTLVLLPKAEWGTHQAANSVRTWSTWDAVYADEYGDSGFWLA